LNRYRGGLVSYLDVIYAQIALLANERTATQIGGQRMVATVVLIKALGGGWLGVPAQPGTNPNPGAPGSGTKATGQPPGTHRGDGEMTKHFPMPMAAAVGLLCAATVSASEAPTERAWLILQEGLSSKRAAKRTNAVHALRIVVHNSRAQDLVEQALADPDLKVRAAAARTLGLMEAVSSEPKRRRREYRPAVNAA
jgi:hypothetical protein